MSDAGVESANGDPSRCSAAVRNQVVLVKFAARDAGLQKRVRTVRIANGELGRMTNVRDFLKITHF
jgi:hypothetical protein